MNYIRSRNNCSDHDEEVDVRDDLGVEGVDLQLDVAPTGLLKVEILPAGRILAVVGHQGKEILAWKCPVKIFQKIILSK